MYYNAMNKLYVSLNCTENPSQLLRLLHDGQEYKPHLLHATIGETRQKRVRRATVHMHDLYHIVLYTNGSGMFQLGGNDQPFQAGTLALSEPGMLHEYGPLPGGTCEYSEITFDYRSTQDSIPLQIPFADMLATLLGHGVGASRVPVLLDMHHAAQLQEMMQEHIRLRLARDTMSELLAWSCLSRILIFVAQYAFDGAQKAQQRELSGVERVHSHIQRNYARSIHVDELAARAGMSRGHFLRKFKEAYGISPIAFQIEQRIRAAQVLLRTTGLRCSEIANRVGYDDVYYFSRCFRKQSGCSPTAYREKH